MDFNATACRHLFEENSEEILIGGAYMNAHAR
jgi:hypothetical protein